MIEKLTKKQESQMAVYRDKWIANGLSTVQDITEDDIARAIEIVSELVLEDGDSPLAGGIICDSPIHMSKLIGSNSFVIYSSFFGNLESSWISSYDFFQEEVGVELIKEFNLLKELSQKFSWMYVNPDDNKLYICRKPLEIHMNNGLLHNESGPSILFSDGFSVYSIDGHRVTEKIVMRPEEITLSEIHNEKNSDVQAIMIDRFSWVRYIEESGAKLLDSRRNDIENTMEALYDTKSFGRRLVCTCPTGRVFVKGCPSDSGETCEEVQNWLSGYNRSNVKRFRTVGRT